MPVLTSPRCMNCHGGTDPVSGVNHGGGAVGPSAVCQDCHTASDEWQSVSGIQFDANVTPMCNTMRHIVQVLGPSAFVNFLASDPVVGLGFDGLRGMDENSPFWPVDPAVPPTDRSEFVQLANDWVTNGNAQCGTGSHWPMDRPRPAMVNINVFEDTYQISFNVPAVTGTWNEESLNDGGCTTGRVSRTVQYPVTATCTIQGKADPNDPTHLKGTSESTGASPLKTMVKWDLNLEDDQGSALLDGSQGLRVSE